MSEGAVAHGFGGILLLGLALGLRHALDPDHLAAVAATVARNPRARRAAWLGALWGGGHGFSVVTAGGLAVLLGRSFPAWAASLAEGFVGLLLVGLGVDLLLVLRRERAHLHLHEHDGVRHLHLHSHLHGADHDHVHTARRAVFLGMAHGLAGSAAVALLAALSAGSRGGGILFLIVFAAGAAAAMAMVSALVSLPLRIGGADHPRPLLWLRATSGLLSVGVGLFVIATASGLGRGW